MLRTFTGGRLSGAVQGLRFISLRLMPTFFIGANPNGIGQWKYASMTAPHFSITFWTFHLIHLPPEHTNFIPIGVPYGTIGDSV